MMAVIQFAGHDQSRLDTVYHRHWALMSMMTWTVAVIGPRP